MDRTHGAHLDYLDGWRGLAIVLLLAGHFFPLPGIDISIAGVNLFFVLSGLLMARLLFVQETPIPQFYRRRISRIFPAVFFFIFAVVAFYLLRGVPVEWAEVLSAALFLKNYFLGANDGMPYAHIWSLCVEEHSYILLSLIAIAARRWKWSAKVATGACAVLCAVIGIIYWLGYPGRGMDLMHWKHTEVSAYGILISAFLLLHFRDKKIPLLPLFVYPLMLAAGIALHWWSVPGPVAAIAGVGLFALAINLLPEAPALVKSCLSFGMLRQLGIWSYSIYLWQQPFFMAVRNGDMPRWMGLCLGLMCGIASFYLLERPVRDFLNRRWGRKEPGTLPTSVKPAG